MAEIEHSIQADESAEVEIGDELGCGFYLRFLGNGSAVKVYVDNDQLQKIFDQLTEWGFKAESVGV